MFLFFYNILHCFGGGNDLVPKPTGPQPMQAAAYTSAEMEILEWAEGMRRMGFRLTSIQQEHVRRARNREGREERTSLSLIVRGTRMPLARKAEHNSNERNDEIMMVPSDH